MTIQMGRAGKLCRAIWTKLRLRELCEANGVAYVRAPTEVPPLDLLFDVARGAELVTL